MKSNDKHCLNLIGHRFGRLVVVDRAEDKIDKNSGKHKSCWICNCDCGTKGKIVIGAILTSGKTVSCGCYHKEVASETAKTKISHGKKYNTYDLSHEYGIGYTNKGDKFFFDLEDYDKIKDICWYKTSRGYITGHLCDDNGKEIKMHQLVMNWDKDSGLIVDHIHSQYKHDNRKCNLRLTTQANNCKNRGLSSNNTSGIPGVSWNKNSQKWTSYIRINNKHVLLGSFKNKQDAIEARKEAEGKYFGEYRYKDDYNLNLRLVDYEGNKKVRVGSFGFSGIALTLGDKEEVDNFVC